MFTELHSRRRLGAPASRDTARQLTVIRSLLLTIAPTAKVETPPAVALESAGRRPLFTLEAMAARKAWARALPSDARKMVISHLNCAEMLGPMRTVARAPADAAIDAIAGDFPHAAPVIAWLKEHLALARCCPGQELSFPPMLLSGSPGTGKTALSVRLAAMMGTHHRAIDMSTLHTNFSVIGLDAGYSTARPGPMPITAATSTPVMRMMSARTSDAGSFFDDFRRSLVGVVPGDVPSQRGFIAA